MILETLSSFLEKPGRTYHALQNEKTRKARTTRRATKAVRIAAATAACVAANRNPTACKKHLEEAARRVPTSHMIVLVPTPSGVKRALIIPKRARKEFIGM